MAPTRTAALGAALSLTLAGTASAAPEALAPSSDSPAPALGDVISNARLALVRERLVRGDVRLVRGIAALRGHRAAPARLERLRRASVAALRRDEHVLRARMHRARRDHAAAPASPVLQAIAACESGGDPHAIGGGGAFRGQVPVHLRDLGLARRQRRPRGRRSGRTGPSRGDALLAHRAGLVAGVRTVAGQTRAASMKRRRRLSACRIVRSLSGGDGETSQKRKSPCSPQTVQATGGHRSTVSAVHQAHEYRRMRRPSPTPRDRWRERTEYGRLARRDCRFPRHRSPSRPVHMTWCGRA
jgi:hypothetical protein